MTTSISLPQHTLEGMYAAKVSIASDQQVNAETMPLQGMDLSTVLPYEDDPYTFSRQMLAQNSHLLPSPVPESSSPGGFHSALTDTPLDWQEVQGASRQLQRDFNLSDDDYMAMGRRQVRSTSNQVATPPHINALENLIETLHGDYQQTYAKINEKAAEFMKDVNTAVGKISDFITAGKDGKINFKPQAFLESMDKIFKKYSTFEVTGTGSYSDWAPKIVVMKDTGVEVTGRTNKEPTSTLSIFEFQGDDKALAFWENKLSGFTVIRDPEDKSTILVKPNLDPIRNIYSSVAQSEASWKGGDTNSQAFQSLQSAIDSQKNAVNSGISQLLERFRQDNSTFETLIQLLQQMTQDLHRYNAGYFQ